MMAQEVSMTFYAQVFSLFLLLEKLKSMEVYHRSSSVINAAVVFVIQE